MQKDHFFDGSKVNSIIHLDILPQYPGWIHPRKFPGENEAYKTSPRWKKLRFFTSPVYIGNLSHPEKNFELLMFPCELLKFWYFLGDIAQTVFGIWQGLVDIIM